MKNHLLILLLPVVLAACAGAEFTTYTTGTGKDGQTKAIPAQRTRLIAFGAKQAMGKIPTPFGMAEDLAQDSTKVLNTAVKTLGTVMAAEIAADVATNASDNARVVDVTNSNNAVSTEQIKASTEVTKSAVDKGLEAIPK